MLSESDLPAILDTFVPEEVWDKFQLDLDLTSALGNIESPFDVYYNDCLLHHDCMWTGLCDDKEHKFDEPRSSSSACNNHNIVEDVKPPVSLTTTGNTTKQQVFQPQQSLLKPRSVNPNTVLPMNNHMTTTTTTAAPTTPTTTMDINNLQTPPMSDDDEEHKPIIPKTLSHIDDATFESMLDDDLMKYIKGEDDVEFEGLLKSIKEEKIDDFEDEFDEFDFMYGVAEESEDDDDDDDCEDEEEETSQNTTDDNNDNMMMIQMRAYRAAASDHSYHKGTISLGIDTPSDSEEEIDVVSISKSTGALPTNPSPKDRHNIQRTMQSRFPQGIKTILPSTATTAVGTTQTRRDIPTATTATSITSSSTTTTKRKVNDNNTTNRGRNSKQYKKYQTQRQYRRRHGYGHSSDSEPEPSEKRSLHNNMERQRRIDLRNLFEDLKALVPEVNKKQRAAKVLILRGAATYCRSLTNTSVELNKKVDELKKRQENLRLRVSQLRRNLAANR